MLAIAAIFKQQSRSSSSRKHNLNWIIITHSIQVRHVRKHSTIWQLISPKCLRFHLFRLNYVITNNNNNGNNDLVSTINHNVHQFMNGVLIEIVKLGRLEVLQLILNWSFNRLSTNHIGSKSSSCSVSLLPLDWNYLVKCFL